MNVTRSLTLWFSSNFWINVDLVSLPELNHILESILIPMLVNLLLESPILQSHILLIENEYEPQRFNLDPILESNLSLKLLLDLSNIPESVLVPVPFILEPKLTPSPNHISLLDQDIGQYKSKMIYRDWAFDLDKCQDTILYDPIQFGSYKTFNGIEVKGEFLRTSHSLDWVATFAPIRSQPEHHLEVTFFLPSLFSMHICNSFIHWG